MAEKKLITQEDLDANPKFAEDGLNVGDEFPKIEKPKKSESATVEVDREMLQKILTEVEGLRGIGEEVKRLKDENEMLLAVADKSRLATYQNRHSPTTLVRTCKVWEWDGKLVKATFTVKNYVFTDNIGRTHVDQVINVITEDGKEREVAYDEFAKEKKFVEGDIISRTEKDGQLFYVVKFKDGKEFPINSIFTN